MIDRLAPGLIIASPASGSGKTTLTLGLLAAFRARGIDVRAAKSGPDYIDPAFHAAACGHPSLNLDSWAMPPALVDSLAAQASSGGELLICEALMGLFDGVARVGAWGNGATADIAARTGWPVVLVVDGRGASQSVAAVVKGFATYRDDVRVAGVVLNNIASPRHRNLIEGAILALGIPVLGALPRTPGHALPERHLGLVQASETEALTERLAALGAWVAEHVDLDRLAALAVPYAPSITTAMAALPPPGQRIALARDAAFSFAYPHVLAGWRAAGAEIVPFSPLADQAPDSGADAVVLPGGYPELHAGRLAAARTFKAGMHALAAQGAAIFGECGGYMTLGEMLVDADGQAHEMLGLLSVQTSFAKRKLHLGYRLITTLADMALGPAGSRFRGHEFHYASVLTPGADAPLLTAEAADGTDLGPLGSRRGSVAGSFLHLIAREG
ncbi:cobyrinate a,c-diamide synthase [Nitrospirillum pindoramense]|uniref:Cobyrinate a,c-diamide synthase n=1 Tax=Nitrospirillum amazonense TaxID=28077 RepID=A0A560H4J2_9PROT|nr:cobyrinate a,c-diamide synthase [Nitrospirillum amazonense]TWB41193.1 cobyrinic acid a,c-diamide synthase [Nitrospirillum amazonense]